MKRKFNKINKNNSQSGFTLLETLIAIFILTLSITGPVYIASVAFRNTIDSRDNISAQYLAEEVVEVVKNNIDRKALNGEDIDFEDFFNSGTVGPDCSKTQTISNKCFMNIETLPNVGTQYVFAQCPSGICPNMSFDPNGNFVYSNQSVVDTSKFIREFYFESISNDAAKLVVNIVWNDRGKDKIYTLNKYLHKINYGYFNDNN